MCNNSFQRSLMMQLLAVWALALFFTSTAWALNFSYEVSASLAQIYDDNIFLEPAAVTKDYISEIEPQVKLVLESPRMSMSASYQPTFSLYAQNFSDNRLQRIAHLTTFDMGYQISPRFILQLSDQYRLTSASEGRPGFAKVDVFQNNELRFYPTYTYEYSDRGKFSVIPEISRRDVEKLAADYYAYGLELQWSRLLNAHYTLSVNNSFQRREYDDLSQDFYLYTVYLVLGIDISRRLEAKIPIGYQLFKPDGNGAQHNQSYQVKIKYFVTPRLIFEPQFTQLFSADLTGQSYNSRRISGKLRYEFSPRLAAEAQAELRDFEYFNFQGLPTKDRLITMDGNLAYEISARSTILFRYQRADNGGADKTSDYEANRYALEFEYRYGNAE